MSRSSTRASGWASAEPPERFMSVFGDIHLVAVQDERSSDRVAHRPFVVDYEDPHEPESETGL